MLTKEQEKRLAQLRREWQQVANGSSLVEINGSVGYLLSDVTQALDLTPEQQKRVLGRKLYAASNGR